MSNRIIKFKFWDKDNKEWVLGSEIEFQENGEPFDLYEKNIIYLQFTGLLDKNGKEIYEGDILLLEDKKNYQVFFDRGCFIVNDLPLLAFVERKKCEIAGNIFEHPDLLSKNGD